jgi:nitrate/TMAO reductase-like tetraheme cytochrome c subunit
VSSCKVVSYFIEKSFINIYLSIGYNGLAAALRAVIESIFQSAVIRIQIYKKVSVNHQTTAWKQMPVSNWANCLSCHGLQTFQ